MNRPLLAPLLPLLLTLLAAASASVAVDAPAPNSHLLAKLPGPCDVDVQFSRGGRFIVTAGGNEARVWDAQTLRPIAHPLKHDDLVAIRVSDRGNVLLTVGAGARLWDPRTGKPLGEPLAVPRHRDDSAWPADVSSDGSMVAATVAVRGGAARPGWEVEVWSVSPRKRLLALRHQAEPGFVAFSPGAKRLVTAEPFDHRPHGGGETFHLWDVATGKEVCPPIVTKYNYGGAENAPAAFSPDLLKSPDYAQLFECHGEIAALHKGPCTVVDADGKEVVTNTLDQLIDVVMEFAKDGVTLQRYKGLGEMNPEQLWETTMNPETRTLLKVTMDDAVGADEIFTILMGDAVEPRREFIERNALDVVNLDV